MILAAAGTFVLVMYVRGAEQRAVAGQEAVDVLVVSELIQEGTPAEEVSDRVDARQVTANVRAEGSVKDLEALKGQVAAVDLVPGEQLVAGRFVEPAAFEAASRVEIPEGHQVVTIDLPPVRAVGGQIRPGDTIGFIVSFGGGADEEDGEEPGQPDGPSTGFVLHKVLVTNIQAAPAPEAEDDDTQEGRPEGNQMISLAVEAGDAERVVFAAEYGSIWLTNEPDGASEDGTSIQRLDRIYE